MADKTQRWTRDYLFDILGQLGIHYIFGVPGTNEIPVIDGTDVASNDVRYIECLHENIAAGAASGYARMSGKPGVMLVHVTPGIAHSIGNLFNAHCSRMPLIVLCAQQQNELVTQEPLLASNLVKLAEQYTKWAHEIRAPEEIPLVLQRAFKEAMAPPNGPVFIAFPWEFMMREIGPDDHVPGVTRIAPRFTGDQSEVAKAAELLAGAKNPIIIGGDAIGYASAWPEVQELAELIGAPVLLETFSSMANFPNSDYHWQGELPGSQAGVQGVFAKHDVAFLCGFHAQAQLAVFKYSNGPLIPPHVRQVYLSNSTWDIGKNYYGECAIFGDLKATLPELNARIARTPPAGAAERNEALRAGDKRRAAAWDKYLAGAKQEPQIWAVVVASALAELIEEEKLLKRFVYVHEAVSDPAPFQYYLPFSPEGGAPTSYYCVEGGSLGWSMPASLGIKLVPEGWQDVATELVVNAVGDGSSLFYPQVWWTAAHRELPVLTLIMNNSEYHTLQLGLQQVIAAYGTAPGYNWNPVTKDPEYLRIERPKFNFVEVAKAFGAGDGLVVQKVDEVKEALRAGIRYVRTNKLPFVIDFRIAQNTPPPLSTTPPSHAALMANYVRRYNLQPALDVAHEHTGLLKSTTEEGAPDNVPVVP